MDSSMPKKVTMQMIADALGITKVSVSKAFNNRADVSDELREKVLATARSMGYVRRPRAGSRSNIHLSFLQRKEGFSGDGFYADIYHRLVQRCSPRRIHLHLHLVSEEEEDNLELPFPFEQNLLDGVFVGGELGSAYLDKIKSYGNPTITIGFYEMLNDIDAVVVDDYYNANQIANALVGMGYDTIGYIADTEKTHVLLDRYYGYVKALKENNLEYRPDWVISDFDDLGHIITNYQLPKSLPRAFMCRCDSAAYHLAARLKKGGLKIPQDVAVTSFDATEMAKNGGCVIGLDVTPEKFADAAWDRMFWRQMNPDQEHQRVIINAPLVYL